jgi:hypothetical protein
MISFPEVPTSVLMAVSRLVRSAAEKERAI